MATAETYCTAGGVEVAAGSEHSGFTIELAFDASLGTSQRAAVKAAARRWTRLVVGDLPSEDIGSRIVDDILIYVSGGVMDGPGGILAQSRPDRLRAATNLPATAHFKLDTGGAAELEAKELLEDVAAHEIGHCLGFGSLWPALGLLAGQGGGDPRFTGPKATAAYQRLGGGQEASVPVENVGVTGSRDLHWREAVFGDELMTSMLPAKNNPISALSVAALLDMGYAVNLAAAEPYVLKTGSGKPLRTPWEAVAVK